MIIGDAWEAVIDSCRRCGVELPERPGGDFDYEEIVRLSEAAGCEMK